MPCLPLWPLGSHRGAGPLRHGQATPTEGRAGSSRKGRVGEGSRTLKNLYVLRALCPLKKNTGETGTGGATGRAHATRVASPEGLPAPQPTRRHRHPSPRAARTRRAGGEAGVRTEEAPRPPSCAAPSRRRGAGSRSLTGAGAAPGPGSFSPQVAPSRPPPRQPPRAGPATGTHLGAATAAS